MYLYDLQAGKWSQWVTDPAGIGYPEWTLDDQFVQYQNDDAPTYIRVKLGSGEIKRLFAIPNENPYATNIGTWSSATPDGAMMYTQDVSSQNGYELDVDFP